MKKNKKITIALVTLLTLIFIGIVVFWLLIRDDSESKKEPNMKPVQPGIHDNPRLEPNYIETVNLGYTDLVITDYKHSYINSFSKYEEFIKKYNLDSKLTEEDFHQRDYLVLVVGSDTCTETIKGIISADVIDDKMKVVVGVDSYCGGICAQTENVFLLPVAKDESKKFEIMYDYYFLNESECEPNIDAKPIIYLYPEKETEVIVKLKYPDKLITSYPKYDKGWKVLAKPTGELIDLKTNRGLYGLYWEGLNTSAKGIKEDGFVVKGEDSAHFLEEKLAILGLNEREANEFIIYWLPLLEANEYNYIRFETMNEINDNMPLEIKPNPDTVIRVLMEFKGLDEPIKVKEQQLKTPIRKGFTVVEWGGTKLN